jgi:hypothetical protein
MRASSVDACHLPKHASACAWSVLSYIFRPKRVPDDRALSRFAQRDIQKGLLLHLGAPSFPCYRNQVSQRRQMASPQSKLTRNISLCGSVISRGPCVATIPRARVLALAFSIPLLPLVYICPVANLRKAFANVASLALIHLQPSLGRCISRIGKHSFVLRVCSLGDAHCWKLTVFEHWHCIRLACFHW